ncbi:MAG TPA: bifunctional phosphopantothenoylcysteine decarboxylase/phosphopantothenate--cysteine ligase CoaBC [Acidobacteriaceae bacterium]|jgi:phosphopantothenoylcysteine decarboxylase/phosphopantothenate--cysteine ligase|nr:bifunctional phosphopantothenoylcysteine decarboxylase/phosphopantothenate--cysteine ligase CoaBC [Acidobacteriaceae bacterium]
MKVTVGVSGGVAAYKAAELVRALQAKALDVHVVMTESATRFVQPLTFAALTGHKVITGLWGTEHSEPNVDSAIEHIAEAQSTELLVVAPATADLLARFAHGLANDFLTTLYLATPAPVVVAPAMNSEMWAHSATQANLRILADRGVHIVPPGVGDLACGMVGPGRLAEIELIVKVVLEQLDRRVSPPRCDLAGDTVMVTAGGTREAIDPVRYLGNRSSGKMGYALAEAAAARGAHVILISGISPLTPPPGVEFIQITSSEEMRTAVLERLPEATIVVKAAAVSDYRPKAPAVQKIKRREAIQLDLEPTADILAEVAAIRPEGTLVIGFAAETEDHLQHGRDKLLRKGADALVLNDVGRPGVGFDSDRNAATFLTRHTAIELPEMSKRDLADRILDEVRALRRPASILDESAPLAAPSRQQR